MVISVTHSLTLYICFCSFTSMFLVFVFGFFFIYFFSFSLHAFLCDVDSHFVFFFFAVSVGEFFPFLFYYESHKPFTPTNQRTARKYNVGNKIKYPCTFCVRNAYFKHRIAPKKYTHTLYKALSFCAKSSSNQTGREFTQAKINTGVFLSLSLYLTSTRNLFLSVYCTSELNRNLLSTWIVESQFILFGA